MVNKVSIKVLGSDKCSVCSKLKEHIENIIGKYNLNASVEKITDIKEIMSYGAISIPAIVINGELKCSGRVPKEKELIEIISLTNQHSKSDNL